MIKNYNLLRNAFFGFNSTPYHEKPKLVGEYGTKDGVVEDMKNLEIKVLHKPVFF